jgi:tRNA/tmRNA/rRNA uracil-C5-methylase (TrmA/RlmC/RlmD family)
LPHTSITRPATPLPPLPPGCEPRCRGCAHRHLPAGDSERQKYRWLAEKLSPWADRLAPLQTVGDVVRWGYRERVCLKTQWSTGQWRIGMPLGDDDVLDLPACPVHSPRVNSVLAILKPVLPDAARFPLAYYVQSARQLVLVLKSARLPATDWLTPSVSDALQRAGLDGLWLHLHPAVGKKIFNKPGWHLLWGKARSQDSDGLWYGPVGFQQLIPALSGRALAAAADFLAPTHTDLVIDLYSGNGASLRRWQAAGADSIGVELDGEACACAADNVPQAAVLRGTCAQRLPQLSACVQRSPARRCLLYANPPRTGLETAVRAWIGGSCRPQRIACLSCSAGTLRRDLEELRRCGYRVERLLPYDFFPHTYHVETLALLQLQDR